MTVLLAISDLSVRRGDWRLIDRLNAVVEAGDIVHLRGPNGTGKTTLLRVVAGLTEPETGAVQWRGASIFGDRQAYGRERLWCGHKDGLKGDLTVAENLVFEQRLRGVDDPQAIETAVATLGLKPLLGRPCGVLSAGQRRRTALARLLLTSAPLWLLDEPLTNLDTAGSAVVAGLIAEHAQAGGAAIVTAHGEFRAPGRTVRPLDLAAA